MSATATAKARHARATETKRKLVDGLGVIFKLDPHRAEMCWRDARGELALEELFTLANVVGRMATRVRNARENRAR